MRMTMVMMMTMMMVVVIMMMTMMMFRFSPQEVEAIMALGDVNDDGSLDMEEFIGNIFFTYFLSLIFFSS